MANAFHAIAPECGASTSSSSKPCYDVFINHRGPDVKHTLASTIYHTLGLMGVRAFLDENELELGGSFPQDLEDAMKSASVHIAMFSPTYAESPWCLEELSFMLRLKQQHEVTIIPVFYHVNPSDLRYVEKGKYADAFRQHKTKRGLDGNPRYNPEKIKEWEAALSNVSWLSGCILFENNCDEGKLLKEIVETAVQKMKKMPLEVAMFPVGLEEAVEDFEIKVGSSTGSDNVQIVGIVGMGGSGKTTMAKKLYNKKRSLENSMIRCCFLSNIRDFSRSNLYTLQQNLLADLHIKHSTFRNIDEGKVLLSRCLRSMKVLIVFDDVDHVDQMDAVLPEGTMEALGQGSFIIVTTREVDVLRSRGISSIYNMKLLDPVKAKQLFCKHASLQPEHVLDNYLKFEHLVEKFVIACAGLPLSLKVLGAMMKGRSKASDWERQLVKLPKRLPNDIIECLKLSYEALEPEQQQMFLDVACFFIGKQKSMVVSIWDGSEWDGEDGWETLVNKCLVGLDQEGNIDMHDHLRDLGRAIAKEASPSRIWKEEQIEEKIIIPGNPGGESVIRGIVTTSSELLTYKFYRGSYPLRLEHCMKNLIKRRPIPRLQLLVVKGNDFREKFKALSSHLIWLRWCDFRGKNLPSWLSLEKLNVLELYNALNLEELWQDNVQLPLQLTQLIIEGARLRRLPTSIGDLKYLKKIFLDGIGPGVKSLPGAFCELGSLEFLELKQFPMLSSLPHHFGKLTNLQTLKLNDVGLKALPDTFKQLTALQSLHIFICRSLRFTSEMVDVLELMTELQILSIRFCPVGELPHLTKQVSLRTLELDGLELRELPNMDQISKLETLTIFDCRQLQNLPPLTNQVSLRTLNLITIRLKELPNLDQLTKLETLYISGCLNLTSMPASLGELSCLSSLTIVECDSLERLPESLGCLSNLRSLQIIQTPVVELGMGNLKSLKFLHLVETKLCSISIPDDCCPSLEKLYVSWNDYLSEIEILPESVREIVVCCCEKLKKMRGIAGLSNLESLMVIYCPNLEVLQSPSVGCEVRMEGCPKAERLYQNRGIHLKKQWGD